MLRRIVQKMLIKTQQSLVLNPGLLTTCAVSPWLWLCFWELSVKANNSLGGLEFVYVMFFTPTVHFFPIFYFRHIGHVGWDPNTGFDVSIFSSRKHYSKYVGMIWPIFRFFFLMFIFWWILVLFECACVHVLIPLRFETMVVVYDSWLSL